MGAFCGEKATKHSLHNGEWPAGSISTHFTLYSIHLTVLENNAGTPYSYGVFGDAGLFMVILHFKRVSPIVAAMLPEK